MFDHSRLFDYVSKKCPSLLGSFKQALSNGAQFVYSAHGIEIPKKPREGVQELRMGAVPEVIKVERSRFLPDLRSIVSRFERGRAYRLVAGTGVGKTTIIPLTMVTVQCSVGIVVVPDERIRDTVQTFVDILAKTSSFAVNEVSRIKTIRELSRLVAPSVAFITATDILIMLSQRNDLFDYVSIGFVYIDECHEKIPQYHVLRYLQWGKWMQNTVVLYGSATSGFNMEGRGTGEIPRTDEVVTEDLLDFRSIGNMSSESPLSVATRMHRRTILFLPRESDFPAVRKYYENMSIQVFELTRDMTGDDITVLYSDLNDTACFVLLTTEVAQTAYTLPLQDCVDTGFSVRKLVDYEKRVVDVKDQLATREEQTQRAGRVGRMSGGVSYHGFSTGTDNGLVLPGSEIYVVLWCIVLNVNISFGGNIEAVKEIFADLAFEQAAVLLGSVVHPLFLIPYLSSGMKVFRGTDSMMAHLTGFSASEFKSIVINPAITERWFSMVNFSNDEEYAYKAYWRVPPNMGGFFAVMWALMKRGAMSTYTTTSVVSTLAALSVAESNRTSLKSRVREWLKNDVELLSASSVRSAGTSKSKGVTKMLPELPVNEDVFSDKRVKGKQRMSDSTVGNAGDYKQKVMPVQVEDVTENEDVIHQMAPMVVDSQPSTSRRVIVPKGGVPGQSSKANVVAVRPEQPSTPKKSSVTKSGPSPTISYPTTPSSGRSERGWKIEQRESRRREREKYTPAPEVIRRPEYPLYSSIAGNNTVRPNYESGPVSDTYKRFLLSLHEDVTTQDTRDLPMGEHVREPAYEYRYINVSDLSVGIVNILVPLGGGIQRAYQMERSNNNFHRNAVYISEHGLPLTWTTDPAQWAISATMAWNAIVVEYSNSHTMTGFFVNTRRDEIRHRAQRIKNALVLIQGYGFSFSYKPKIPTGLQ